MVEIIALKRLMKRHVMSYREGNTAILKAIEKEMKRYGCNGSKETFKNIKKLIKEEKIVQQV